MASPKTIPIETDVILLFMATDFDDLNIDLFISLQYEIYDTLNLLANGDDDTDLDIAFVPAIGKMIQRHLLYHISWLQRAMNVQPQCNHVCAARNCLDEDNIDCPRDNWRQIIIKNTGDYQGIPPLPRDQVVDKCMKVIVGINRMTNQGRWN